MLNFSQSVTHTALRERLMNRPHSFLMRRRSTAHFIHNKFPFFFNKMFLINISVAVRQEKERRLLG